MLRSAGWLAALQATNLAAHAQGLFSGAQSLFSNLVGSVPQGVRFQNTLGRPDFGQMVQAHQAWLAKNDPGFYGWQAQVQKAVQKQVKQEEKAGDQLLGLIIGGWSPWP